MRLFGRAAAIVFATLSLLGATAAGPVFAATDPAASIDDFYVTLRATMQNGPRLGESGRYDTLAPVVRRDFDLPAMAQMAVGPGWAQMSPAEQQQVTDAFARYTIASYADHFTHATGEQLQVTGTQTTPYGTIVQTKIVQPGGDETSVNYLMRRNGNAWQVADVYLEGTISQIAALRSQFSAVFLRGGAPALVEALNQKAARLGANPA
jgi:phospholipid transport system substrate-binding protein